MTDLTALHGLTSVGGDLLVSDNLNLPNDDALALAVAIESIGGTTQIFSHGWAIAP